MKRLSNGGHKPPRRKAAAKVKKFEDLFYDNLCNVPDNLPPSELEKFLDKIYSELIDNYLINEGGLYE